MTKNDLFDGLNDMDIEDIAQDFPVLTDEEKERIYSMSERKYSISDGKTEEFSHGAEVSGVEVYKRPKWKTASIAASLALLIGAGSFGGYNIAQQLHRSRGGDEDVPTTAATDMSHAATEHPYITECRRTAEELLARYNSFIEPFDKDLLPKYPEIEESDTENMTEEEIEEYYKRSEEEIRKIEALQDEIWFELGEGDPFDHANYKHIGSWYYHYYDTGMKFSSTDEVMDEALSFMSQSFIEKQFPKLIGEDLSDYETDRTYRQDIESCPDFGIYAMYNGKLYCDCDNYRISKLTYKFYERKDVPVEISGATEDSFTATVKYEFTSIPNKHDMTIKAVKKDGNWIIDDIEPTGPEADPQKVTIIDKMLNSRQYYDNLSAKSACMCYSRDNQDYSLKLGAFYSDTRANRSYNYYYYGKRYFGEPDTDSMLEYARNNFSPEAYKEEESYCDGEKNYYWCNPLDLDGDESNGNEYSWYHMNSDVPTDEKISPDLFRLDENGLILYRYIPEFYPYGIDLVTNYLYEYSNWDITGEKGFEGRACYVIEGSVPKKYGDIPSSFYPTPDNYATYRFYIDEETGIPLLEAFYEDDNTLSMLTLCYDVGFGSKAEPVPEIDMDQYDMSSFTYK